MALEGSLWYDSWGFVLCGCSCDWLFVVLVLWLFHYFCGSSGSVLFFLCLFQCLCGPLALYDSFCNSLIISVTLWLCTILSMPLSVSLWISGSVLFFISVTLHCLCGSLTLVVYVRICGSLCNSLVLCGVLYGCLAHLFTFYVPLLKFLWLFNSLWLFEYLFSSLYRSLAP